MYDFKPFEKIRSFGEVIVFGKIAISEVEERQNNLLDNKVEFYNKSGPKTEKKGRKKGKNSTVWILFMKAKNLMLSKVEYFL